MKNKAVLDIILFGSAVKGKEKLGEIDLAIIFREVDRELVSEFNKRTRDLDIEVHVSEIKVEEFFKKQPPLINTLLREGFSLKNNQPLANCYNFNSAIMYIYNLKGMKAEEKVKFVYLMRGRKKEKGFVESNGGSWLAKQVFTVPLESEKDMEEVMKRFKIKYQRHFVLIH